MRHSSKAQPTMRRILREKHGVWRGALFPDFAGAAETVAHGHYLPKRGEGCFGSVEVHDNGRDGNDGRLRFATTKAFLQRFGLTSLSELTATLFSDGRPQQFGTALM